MPQTSWDQMLQAIAGGQASASAAVLGARYGVGVLDGRGTLWGGGADEGGEHDGGKGTGRGNMMPSQRHV